MTVDDQQPQNQESISHCLEKLAKMNGPLGLPGVMTAFKAALKSWEFPEIYHDVVNDLIFLVESNFLCKYLREIESSDEREKIIDAVNKAAVATMRSFDVYSWGMYTYPNYPKECICLPNPVVIMNEILPLLNAIDERIHFRPVRPHTIRNIEISFWVDRECYARRIDAYRLQKNPNIEKGECTILRVDELLEHVFKYWAEPKETMLCDFPHVAMFSFLTSG